MAGESAHEVARRQREKADRLLRSAESWERGAEGEVQTARALAQLPAHEWRVIHDVRWPGRRFANIDHVVVGTGGIFVIDSKNWSGRLEVREQVLTQNGRKREQAVAGAADAAIAVAELLPGLDPHLVKPVLCFVRDEPVTGWARDVMVCSTSNLVDMLQSRAPVFVVPEVSRQYSRLSKALASAARAPARPARAQPATRLVGSRAAVPPSPPRMSSRGPGTEASRRQASRGVGRLLVGLALLVIAWSTVRSGLVGTLVQRAVASGEPATHAAGSPLELRSATSALMVSETSVEPVTALRPRRDLGAGERLWSVTFVVRNLSSRALTSPWPVFASVVDELGRPHPVVSGVAIKGGDVLPVNRLLMGRATASGRLVFSLPKESHIVEVRLAYGADSVRWRTGSGS